MLERGASEVRHALIVNMCGLQHLLCMWATQRAFTHVQTHTHTHIHRCTRTRTATRSQIKLAATTAATAAVAATATAGLLLLHFEVATFPAPEELRRPLSTIEFSIKVKESAQSGFGAHTNTHKQTVHSYTRTHTHKHLQTFYGHFR